MKAQEFKSEIKKLKNQLRGKTLQLITSNTVTPFNTLNSFGNAILNEEKKGNSFSISQVWIANEGSLTVTSLSQLAQLFVFKSITGIQFKSYCELSNDSKYTFGSLD